MERGVWDETAVGCRVVGGAGSDQKYAAGAAHEITANTVESTLLAGRERFRARSYGKLCGLTSDLLFLLDTRPNSR